MAILLLPLLLCTQSIHGSLAALAAGGSEPLQQLQLAKAATWMAI